MLCFLQILSGFLTPLIAVLTAYIAYQQYRTNKDKLRLELYEKRFEAYDALIKLLSHIIREGTAKESEIWKYTEVINKRYFLFDSKTTDYLFEIRSKSLDLVFIKEEQKIPDLNKKRRGELATKWHETILWLEKQIKESKRKFNKYLRNEY